MRIFSLLVVVSALAGAACDGAPADDTPKRRRDREPVDTSCTPNAIGCVDATTAFVCNADGASRTEAPCRADQICTDGACITLQCAPSSKSCSGNTLLSCNADGSDQNADPCDTSSTCTDTGFGCACVDNDVTALCQSRVCTPASARCVGNSAQACDNLGLGFSELLSCGADSCVGGLCLPDTCTVGTSFCSGTTLLVCDQDGVGYDAIACPEACDGNPGTAACVSQRCTPFAQVCFDDATLSVCNAQGTQTDLIGCGAGKICRDSVCVDDVCTPDCSGRTCGPDPICGFSCGPCAGSCSNGVCSVTPPPPTGPLMLVELSWATTTEDLDLYLSRDPSAAMCASDTCDFQTCMNGHQPDWDGSGGKSAGDPSLDIVDASHANPEVISLTLSNTAQHFRVGAHHFPGTGTTAVSATIRVLIDGTAVATHTRSIAVDAMWQGVVLTWNGSTLTTTDDATTVASFDCAGSAPPGCLTDADCPATEYCAIGTLLAGLADSCAVGCRSDANCSGNQVCNGDHACAAGTTLAPHASCTTTAQCAAGFQCQSLFGAGTCEELCSLTGACADGGADCCPKTGGTCSQGFPVFAATCG